MLTESSVQDFYTFDMVKGLIRIGQLSEKENP